MRINKHNPEAQYIIIKVYLHITNKCQNAINDESQTEQQG